MTSLLDVTATILDLANTKIPDTYHSKSLIEMLKNDCGRDHIFMQISESQLGRAIITDKYTYSIRKPFSFGLTKAKSKIYKEDLLYDNEKDKAQHKNVIRKSEYKQVKKQLREIILSDIEKIEGVSVKIIK